MFQAIRNSNVTLLVLCALLLAMLWFMFGCTPMPRLGATVPAQTWTGESHTPPDVAQHLAYETLVDMRGEQVTTAPMPRHVSGVLSGAVLMHITITATQAGSTFRSQFVVTGSVLPDKVVLGDFDEVERYVAAWQHKMGTAQVRAQR